MRHALTGYVLEVTPEMNRITVRNEDIPGTMVSMVMDYRVRDVAALARIKPGDVIQATKLPRWATPRRRWKSQEE